MNDSSIETTEIDGHTVLYDRTRDLYAEADAEGKPRAWQTAKAFAGSFALASLLFQAGAAMAASASSGYGSAPA